MGKRMITTEVLEEDIKIEGTLRPQTLDDYIGQEKTKGKSESLYRSGKAERGCAGSCPVLWTARSG